MRQISKGTLTRIGGAATALRMGHGVIVLTMLAAAWGGLAVPAQAQCIEGFTEVVSDGFGDRYNLYAWSQIVYDGRLYVGTFNEVNGGQIWRYNGETWEMVLSQSAEATGNTGFRSLTEFDGYLYAGGNNTAQGAELWRSADGAEWEQVVAGGFGYPANISVRGVAVFRQWLYVGLQNQSGTGSQLWRSQNGTDWSPVNQDGFGRPGNQSVHAIAVFRGRLYVGTKNDNLLQVLRSTDGTTFETVVGPGALMNSGFGIPHNANTQHMHVYNGVMYIGTGNDLYGFSVFRTLDGIHYQPVSIDGMGDPANMFAWRFFTFQNKLWMGVGNFDILNGKGGSLVRSGDGMNWKTMVGLDGRFYGYGFDNWRNWGIRSFAEYNGDLYIGTAQCWDTSCRPLVTGLQIWRWKGCVGGEKDTQKTPSYTDPWGEPGQTYGYELVTPTEGGDDISSPVASATAAPQAVVLFQNFPNPFNPQTTIAYTVTATAMVSIEVFDASGSLVTRLDQGGREAGSYQAEWDGRDAAGRAVASGIYLYRLAGVDGAGTRKMVLLR